ncbi:MAG: PAS domain S-box protein [Candidatus Solibacter sp.]
MAGARRIYPKPLQYCLALATVVLAIGLRLELTPLLGNRSPYLLQIITVLVCARIFGFGPSLLGFSVVIAQALRQILLSPAGSSRSWFSFWLVVACWIGLCWLLDRHRRTSLLARERLEQLGIEVAHREREEQLSAQLRAIVESSDDAIVSLALDGRIESWNRGAEQLYGHTAEEAIGKPATLLLPPERHREEQDLLERILGGARVKHFESVRLHKNGKELRVSLTVSPIRNARGSVTGASYIARDITESKQLEEQLLATQKLESLGVLAGGLAHDFNNLLTSVMGNTSLALDDLTPASPARARLQEVLSASERAALLVRQMLAYAGKGRFVVRPLDLSTQIAEIVPLIRTSVPPMVKVELKLAEGLPLVQADAAQMQQLIMNLAINAVEAVGEVPGTVTFATWKRSGEGDPEVVLQVKDNGCGMDEATNARIFDPFFTTKFPGRGLGLAAAHGIIRGHGGSVSVESTRGAGTTFTVVFPASDSSRPEAGEPAGAVECNGHGNVLVVDDEEMVRNMARVMLERAGYQVETAEDGSRAVDCFAARPGEFDAVLLDLTMPVMSGQEALQRIHAIRPGTPVILSSGFSEEEALSRFQGYGLAGFLQKPYTAAALARKVRQATNGSA